MHSNPKASFGLALLVVLFGLLFLTQVSSADIEPVKERADKLHDELDRETVDPEYEVVEGNSISEDGEDVSDLMQKFLKLKNKGKGWQVGVNNHPRTGKKFFISMGVGKIAAKVGHKSFINSRQRAFIKAMAEAQRDMVEYIGTEIETSMSLHYQEPSEEREEARLAEIKSEVLAIEEKRKASGALKSDVAKKADQWGSAFVKSLASGADRLYRDKLDKQLIEKGIDPNKPVEGQLLKKVMSESFQEATKLVAQSQVSGLQAYKTFEHLPKSEENEIGVIAIWSKKLNAMALSIGGDAGLMPPGTPKAPLTQQLPKSKLDLLMTYGVQLRTDENGRLNLVSFYQSGQRSKRAKKGAQRNAKAGAMKQIRRYAGEAFYSRTNAQQAESFEEFENGMEVYKDDSSIDDFLESKSEKLNIKGIATLKQWHAKHPVTNQRVVGVVVSWSPDSARLASQVRSAVGQPDEERSRLTEKSRAAAAAQQTKEVGEKQEAAGKKQSAAPKEKPRKALSGSGATASDDF